MKTIKIIIISLLVGLNLTSCDFLEKDLEVEVISKGLKVIAPQKTKSGVEAFNVLQHFTDFIGSRPIRSAITRKHKELLQINHNLLRRLSKRN